MIILDTCVLIFDALQPNRLNKSALQAITDAESNGDLYCSDISLWEIAMQVEKGRLNPGTATQNFIQLALQLRNTHVLSITPEIATLSAKDNLFNNFKHYDPADRLIAATTMYYKGTLITSDNNLRRISNLRTIW